VIASGTSSACLLDASVALKWFLPVEREPDGPLARSAIGNLAMRTTALAIYEVGNILLSADEDLLKPGLATTLQDALAPTEGGDR
jgi:predicted nucleic acid-binding protein